MKQKISISISFALLVSVGAWGQVLKITDNELLKSSSLHWYGLDFSNTVIFDVTQIGRGERLKETAFIEWQAYFNKHVSDKKLKRWFRTSELIDHRKIFYNSYSKLDAKTLVRGNNGSMKIGLDIDDESHVQEVLRDMVDEGVKSETLVKAPVEISISYVDSCVKSYDLQESSGLGAIMIIEKMSKVDKGTYLVGVFFDIATRETLFIIRDKGGWDSYGFIAVYGSGINDGVARVGDKFRRKVLTQF